MDGKASLIFRILCLSILAAIVYKTYHIIKLFTNIIPKSVTALMVPFWTFDSVKSAKVMVRLLLCLQYIFSMSYVPFTSNSLLKSKFGLNVPSADVSEL